MPWLGWHLSVRFIARIDPCHRTSKRTSRDLSKIRVIGILLTNPLPHPLKKVQIQRMSAQHENSEASVLVKQAMELHESNLIAYATNILSGDNERAREVVQDTFVKLFMADPGKVRDNLKAWLYTVCRNRALDVLRKENRMDFGNEDFLDNVSDWRPDPSQQSDTHELCDRVWELVENLTKNQREVVRLKFIHDCSYKDIASITGLTIGNVGFIMHVAIKKLRVLLNQELSETPKSS